MTLWRLLGSLTTRVSSRSLCDTLQPSLAPVHGERVFSFLYENFGVRARIFEWKPTHARWPYLLM